MADDLTFVGTDPTRWGDGKGAPLNEQEFDRNIWGLKQRIDEALAAIPAGVGIANITSSGSQMTITLTNAAQFVITLPKAVMQFRGAWQAGRVYQPLDMIHAGGFGFYLVLLQHTAAATFDPLRGGGNPVYYFLFPTGIQFGTAIDENRELTIDDAFLYFDIEPSSDSDAQIELTVPEDSSDNPWEPGTTMTFETRGANLKIIEGDGVTVNCSALKESRTEFSSVLGLLYKGNNVWTLTGDLLLP